MSIDSFTIVRRDGSRHTVRSGVRIMAASSRDIRIGVEGNAVTLEGTPSPDLYRQAYDKVALTDPYISKINHISPLTDGSYFINSDSCTSWKPLRGGLQLFDMCPSCTDCRDLARATWRYGWLMAGFNGLKDVNLYSDSVVKARARYLEKYLNETANQAGCKEAVNTLPEKYRTLEPLQSTELLHNYLAAVHMWNYAVSRMNSSTEISAAPESPSGLAVQTRHALPACDGKACIKVVVSVEPVSVVNTMPLDLLVIPSASFQPFKVTDSAAAEGAVVVGTAGGRKVASTEFMPAKATGTYFLSVKVLPFINTVATEPTNTSEVLGSSHDDYFEYTTKKWHIGSSTEVSKLAGEPTVEDYGRSSAVPTKSVDGLNMWHITVEWTLKGVQAEDTTDVTDFYFRTAAVREPVDGLMNDSTLRYIRAL